MCGFIRASRNGDDNPSTAFGGPPPFAQGRLSHLHGRMERQRHSQGAANATATSTKHEPLRASFGLCIRAPPVADTARRQRRSGRNAAKRTASLRISGTASWGLYRPDGQQRPTQRAPFTTNTISYRDVAQFGSALRSGRRGRRFESCHLDQKERVGICLPFLFRCNTWI